MKTITQTGKMPIYLANLSSKMFSTVIKLETRYFCWPFIFAFCLLSLSIFMGVVGQNSVSAFIPTSQEMDNQAEDHQAEDHQAEDHRRRTPEDNQSEDNQAEDNQSEDNQSEDNQSEDNQSEDKQALFKKN